VLRLGVLEVVVDTLFLEQTAQEVERRLAVLHAVHAPRWRALELELQVRKPVLLGHLLEYVLEAHVLEDPAVRAGA
jgi:hypothetical protein